jgi:SAM-dependent methyltransferase
MVRTGVTREEQLIRQLEWLRDSWSWLIRTKVLADLHVSRGRPAALDVGCGTGLVMDLFSPMFDLTGIDIDREMVHRSVKKGLQAVQGDASEIPFTDGSFDVVYCSYTFLWLKDPRGALREMARTSNQFVVLLAEPDYGGRICLPKEVADLDPYLVASLIGEGADPFIGRKIGYMMEAAGLEVEMGVHSGVWSPTQLCHEAKGEWSSISDAIKDIVDQDTLELARVAWDRALADRSLFLYNPVFYAIGRK